MDTNLEALPPELQKKIAELNVQLNSTIQPNPLPFFEFAYMPPLSGYTNDPIDPQAPIAYRKIRFKILKRQGRSGRYVFDGISEDLMQDMAQEFNYR